MTTYVSPGHVISGAPATASWADQVSDSMDYIFNGVHRWKVTTVDSATNSFTSGTPKIVAWELETYDPAGLHGTGASDTFVTIVNPGLYLVRFTLNFAGNATGFRSGWISKGPTGTTPSTSTTWTVIQANESNATAGTSTTVTIDDEIECAAGDVLWVVGSQNSGGALAVATNAWSNSFSGRHVQTS